MVDSGVTIVLFFLEKVYTKDKKQSLIATKNKRPDLYNNHKLTKEESKILNIADEYFETIVNKSKKNK